MIYFLIGGSMRKIEYDKLEGKIKKENPNIEKKVFDIVQNEEENFLLDVEMNSMFEGKKLLILKRAEKRKRIEGLFKILTKYNLQNKEIIIDFDNSEKEFSKSAIKIAKELGKIIEVKKDKGNNGIIEYIKEELKINTKQAHNLMEMIGTNIEKITNEIEKIKNFFDGEEFDIKKVKKIITIQQEYSIFELLEELMNGSKRGLIDYLQREKAYILFIYTFLNKLKMNLKLKLLQNEGQINMVYNYNSYIRTLYPKLKKYFTVHPYALFKQLQNMDNKSIEFYEKKIDELLKVELKIKSGEMNDETAIELFIMKF
ncbi:MAG: hypothetical protein B6I28_04265 [Fusobacteriia bacterium 4572_132]|nr:MAG: hypothetical protein B6I28_04265 [Fusobacteriia bacterium 4572_132]